MTTGVVTLGETMGLFRAAELGSLAHVTDFKLAIGGAESNVAIGVARLGAPSTWIGRIGADGLGDRVVRELRAESVTVVAAVDDSASTGLMVKEQRTAAATRVTYYRSVSAGRNLSVDDIPAGLIEEAQLVHVTGITAALSDSAHAALHAAIDRARDAGVPVSFDVNHRNTLWRGRDASSEYRDIAARSNIVFAGLDEARLLVAGTDPATLAASIAALGPTQVVIKLGERGCLGLIDGETHEVAAVRITPVDTVGAGDAFVAGYLAELLAGLPARQRLETAVRTGAFACLGPGDWEGYARRDELAILESREPVER
ncbi:sugar kinase [Microcella sp.]|uniref:sugar kinase n=1 Tax=Microcella sp. TaxID=1913979 RepID=UPI002568BE57|nr:sugar kinase [Microcella sp.]MBX9472330.1 sugar kinase [Microcella sp.]